MRRLDRQALQGFTCTVAAPRDARGRPLPHPRPWEREIESYFRKRPRLGPGQEVRLGWDQEGIAAAVDLQRLSGGAATFMNALAVSISYRGTGGGCADEAMEEAANWAAEQANTAALSEARLMARCHVENAASRRGLIRHGFIHVGTVEEYEEWLTVLPILGDR